MGPETLAQVLRPLRTLFRPADFPDLLVGLEVADDAAVYRITDELAVIQTLDFITPVVDDPYLYGAIAAANALSDIYAMGGEVALALNIAAFPQDLPTEMISEILRGGAEKVAEAGGVLAGGHTITDEEPKYGLAVMGLIHPRRILTKAGARPGDVLVLTKPLGVGLVATAAKGDQADPAHLSEAVASMSRLNRAAARLLQQAGVDALTDVTGFGLLGHGCEMAEKSGVRLRFFAEALPFVSGAREYAQAWLFPAGTCNNEKAYQPHVTFGAAVEEELQQLLFTPETSGGLLAALRPDRVEGLLAGCAALGQACWVVGEVVQGEGVGVF
jgi:selenide, water dikinase